MATNVSISVLLVTIALSYAHQVCRIKFQNSPLGLSPYFVLFNTLFATTQYSNFLLFSCYRYPILSCIAKQELRGLHAYVAILGLLQVAIVWLGSMMLYVPLICGRKRPCLYQPLALSLKLFLRLTFPVFSTFK